MKAGYLYSLPLCALCASYAYASDCGGISCEDMDATQTFAMVEEILTPNRPSDNLWLDNMNFDFPPQAALTLNQEPVISEPDNYCPFETDVECDIWRTKPIVRETVVPRSPIMRDAKINEFLTTFKTDGYITGDNPAAAAFMERYKILVKSAHACCTSGMVHTLKNAGATDGLVYKFLVDDANFYNMSERCLMASDGELIEAYRDGNITNMVSDVRMGCLCQGRDWFINTLQPFIDAWRASPEFAMSDFYWTYTDGLNRQKTVSVNNDVENVLHLLEQCP